MQTTERPDAEPLLLCPRCELEMRLLGIEAEEPGRDLYTFECDKCEHIEVGTVRTL